MTPGAGLKMSPEQRTEFLQGVMKWLAVMFPGCELVVAIGDPSVSLLSLAVQGEDHETTLGFLAQIFGECDERGPGQMAGPARASGRRPS